MLFGTTSPDGIEALLDAYCFTQLDRLIHEISFYRRGVGAVFGIRLDDGTGIVVKVHRPDLVGQTLRDALRIQRHLADRGLPAPRPLAMPSPLAFGIATSEELLDGGHTGDGHDPSVRSVLARGLFEFVQAAPPLAADVQVGRSLFDAAGDAIWPMPHDLRFDLTLPGGEWIDEAALQAKRRLRRQSGRLVIGHADWRVENLRVDADRIVAIFDWDSVTLAREPVLVGTNSTAFTADWSNLEVEPRPSLEESRDFIRDYETARGRLFTEPERQTADAAHLYALAYHARCEHSDTALQILPHAGPDRGWRRLLQARLSSSLLSS